MKREKWEGRGAFFNENRGFGDELQKIIYTFALSIR